ncbi:MAG TPA: Bax inhibitor-1/YccA family protein [Gaiellaceae bacterium]|nr:Bax inhibitor-1/YccA family protein [Gaiellaceae bacterium]
MDTEAATYPALAVEEERSFLTRVMGWMFTGLAITGVIAWAFGTSEDAVAWFDDHIWVFLVLIVAQFVAVAGLSLRIQHMSPPVAAAVFLGYSALNGLTFSIIFSVYTTTSIAGAFFVTSAMFGALALYGWRTKRDLSSVGSIAFMALIGLILASVVNLFWANGALYWITTYAGVAIFAALTAYDMQKIKQLNVRGNAGTDDDKREAILGALALYLDFINLFLFILRIFGRQK